MILWIVAYGWLILSGVMLFLVDVVSQHLRGVRTPSVETTYFYGMNTAAALGQKEPKIISGVFVVLVIVAVILHSFHIHKIINMSSF